MALIIAICGRLKGVFPSLFKQKEDDIPQKEEKEIFSFRSEAAIRGHMRGVLSLCNSNCKHCVENEEERVEDKIKAIVALCIVEMESFKNNKTIKQKKLCSGSLEGEIAWIKRDILESIHIELAKYIKKAQESNDFPFVALIIYPHKNELGVCKEFDICIERV